MAIFNSYFDITRGYSISPTRPAPHSSHGIPTWVPRTGGVPMALRRSMAAAKSSLSSCSSERSAWRNFSWRQDMGARKGWENSWRWQDISWYIKIYQDILARKNMELGFFFRNMKLVFLTEFSPWIHHEWRKNHGIYGAWNPRGNLRNWTSWDSAKNIIAAWEGCEMMLKMNFIRKKQYWFVVNFDG
jgi:hypothetical protein